MNIIVSEPQISLFLRRRFSPEDLAKVVDDVKELLNGGIMDDMALYDGVREFIKDRKFSDIDEFGDDESYWRSYLAYEKPLAAYVRSKLELD